MINKKRMKDFYESQIEDNFLLYWTRFVDSESGGILNCINNCGKECLNKDKYTWSQGRWLWILARIHALKKIGLFPGISQEMLEIWMKGTWDFICNHAIYGDNICCYVLTRNGEKKIDERSKRYDASIYADCFALIGMSQYVKTMEYSHEADKVQALYQSIVRRIEEGNFLTEPYPIPEGYCVHGIPMILINTIHEYILMKQSLNINADEEIAYARTKAEFILNALYDGNGYIQEHKSDVERENSHMLDRHRNPGHTLEDLWFLAEFLEQFGGLENYLSRISTIAKKTFYLGWDNEYGGLLRFVDCEGGKPKGISTGSAYEQLMENTWDMKLWWPHSEMLYLFPKLYELTADDEFLMLYEKSFTYAFTTFPDPELGEWIQIRRRDGSPEEKLVALPVKDPFHIMRNFLKLVELCL